MIAKKRGEKQMKSKEIFFVSFLAGIVIGILIAPDSGKNSRAKIKEVRGNLYPVSKDLSENLGSLTAALYDNMNPYRDQMEMKIKEIKAEA